MGVLMSGLNLNYYIKLNVIDVLRSSETNIQRSPNKCHWRRYAFFDGSNYIEISLFSVPKYHMRVRARVRTCANVRAGLRAYVPVRVHVRVRACTCANVRARLRAYVPVCVCMCACVPVCMCVPVSVR